MDAFREALIDAVINGWASERNVVSVAVQAARDCGKRTDDPLVAFNEVFGLKWVDPKKPIRAAVSVFSPAVSDMLWAGRKTDLVRDSLRRRFGGVVRKGHRIVSVRENDKSHDWATVK